MNENRKQNEQRTRLTSLFFQKNNTFIKIQVKKYDIENILPEKKIEKEKRMEKYMKLQTKRKRQEKEKNI